MESKDIVKECAICHKTFINPTRKEFNGLVCKNCSRNYQTYYKKTKAIEYLGGKCEICGYDKNISALDFHHKNPEEKEISVSLLYQYSWERMKEELDKCQLLCANCHRELHYKLNHLN